MSDAFIGPSGLHLKKDLSVLRNARVLRDPETNSSLRSSLSSTSVAAAPNWNYRNVRGSTGANSPLGSFECNTSPPQRSENNCKKVFLYNWRQQSGKSSDSGGKLGHHNWQGSTPGSPEDRFTDTQKGDAKSNTYVNPAIVLSVGQENRETSRRLARKLKRSAISKQKKKKTIQNFKTAKQQVLPSTSLGVLNTVNRSDEMDGSNSEELQLPPYKFTRRRHILSHSTSSLLSGDESWSLSSKVLKNFGREGSSYSCTPVSTGSYNRYINRFPSTFESWDAAIISSDRNETDHVDLVRSEDSGTPCNWTRKTKSRSCGSCFSPSLSDSLRRKGSNIFCRTHMLYKRRSLGSHRHKIYPKSTTHSLPLLTNGHDGVGSSIDLGTDELSTHFGELDLEASSRLDGRRWLTSKSGPELTVAAETDDMTPCHKSLSQKYEPRSFDEFVGQNVVVQSLRNAILRGRIAPAYLFHGPRGTGKTTAARIFSVALNCLSTEGSKPCGFCRECTNFASEKNINICEVDATSSKEIDRVKHLVKNLSVRLPFYCFKIFIIKECHKLPTKAWSAFLKFLKEAPSKIVFIFVTSEIDNFPNAVLEQCQKYLFLKIKDADIVTRLKNLVAEENLDVESDALDLIALSADGSLRDAEATLEQLSLMGGRITTSLVTDLVGVVSDERLLNLLELALSSDTAEKVKRARELLDTGVDPLSLMSQLAGLIMDIIAGTCRLVDSKGSAYLFGQSLNEAELERLKRVLRILSEAEKQLQHSNERSTWFTAALLRVGSGSLQDPSNSNSSSRVGHENTKELLSASANEISKNWKNLEDLHALSMFSSSSTLRTTNGLPNSIADQSSGMSVEHLSCNHLAASSCMSRDKLDEIWRRCIDKCHSKTLRQLCSTGKLQSVLHAEGLLIVYIAFWDVGIKSRAERFLSSITNSIEIVLRHNVEVRMILIPETADSITGVKPSELLGPTSEKQIEIAGFNMEQTEDYNKLEASDQESHQKPVKPPQKSYNSLRDVSPAPQKSFNSSCDVSLAAQKNLEASSSPIFSKENNQIIGIKETTLEIPTEKIQGAFDKARSENVWVHNVENNASVSVTEFNPDKNKVWPQYDIYHQKEAESTMALTVSSKHWDDELNNEIKINDIRIHEDRRNRRVDHYPMSPSLLHTAGFAEYFDKENHGSESESGCNGLFCWKTSKSHARKVKKDVRVRSPKQARFSLFGSCGKSNQSENRFRK